MKKVLVLSHTSEYLGGAERSILDVLDIWKRDHNIEVEFILRKPLSTYTEALDKRGYKYYALDYTFWSDSNLPSPQDKERRFTTALRNSRATLAIEKIIEESKPDLVITNSIVAPWAAIAAYYMQVPHVWFVREYGDLDHGRKFEIGRAKTFQDIGALSSLVIANSHTLAEHVGQYIDQNKITTLYNPFDISMLEHLSGEKVNNPFRRDKSLKLIITSGAVNATKGHIEAITAVGILKSKGYDVELAALGKMSSPEFKTKIDKLVEEYNVKEDIHFVGFQKNPLAFASKADLGIMASRQEAFGRVTFEYLAIGLPVVGSDSGATPELIDNGENGQLYDVTSADDLASKIEKYILNPKLVASHGKKAKMKAKSMMEGPWTPESSYKKIDKLLAAAKPLPIPIHFTHRWLHYPEISREYYESLGSISLAKIVKIKLKSKIRPAYLKVRAKYSKITGRF